MTPKYIFFDWHNTLSKDIFWPNDEKISEIIFSGKKDIVNQWMRGEKTSEEICEIIQETIGINKNLVLEKLINGCRRMNFVLPDLPQQIVKIKGNGIKVGIATDNMDTFLRFTEPKLKLREMFDDILVSSEVGFLKTDVESGVSKFFNNFTINNKIDYREIVLVDDSQKIFELYKDLGLKVLVVNNRDGLREILLKLQSNV